MFCFEIENKRDDFEKFSVGLFEERKRSFNQDVILNDLCLFIKILKHYLSCLIWRFLSLILIDNY